MGNVASPSKLPVRIGGNIRRYRKFRRWTQERLAEQAGLSTYFIGSVERGQAALSLRSLEQKRQSPGGSAVTYAIRQGAQRRFTEGGL